MALIQCPYCSNQISDKAQRCPYCNNLIINPNSKIKYRDYIKSPISESLHPKSWMLESILLGLSSFLLFTIWCLPFAITSFIYANRVERLWESGDIEGAIHASEKAKKYFTIGAWIGIGLCLVLFLFIMILLIILYIIPK